jgi:excisionase family DNA binding protein
VKSVQEVASELGVRPKVVYGEIRRGLLAAHKIGRSFRISDEALADYKLRTLVVPAATPTRTPRRSPRPRRGEVRHLRALHEQARDA